MAPQWWHAEAAMGTDEYDFVTTAEGKLQYDGRFGVAYGPLIREKIANWKDQA